MPPLARHLAAVVVVILVAFLAWRWLLPSEEDRVRRRLEALAADMNDVNDVRSNVSGLAAMAKVGSYFTADVVIDPGQGAQPLHGREVILSAAASLRPSAGVARLSLTDIDVTLGPDQRSAAVTLTALLTRNREGASQTRDAHEFALTMTKRESEWLISHVTSVDTLR